MIPKVIHFCWFSSEEYPDIVKKCLRSWQKKLPDYTLRLWDGKSFDFDSVPYVREGIAAKKWAVAADYVRLHALYTEGSIYLDSDVEVLKSFDAFLDNAFFTGTEPYVKEGEIFYDLEGAIFGAEKGHPFLKECLDYYREQHYRPETFVTVCTVMTTLLQQHGYRAENRLQRLPNGCTVYPLEHYGDRYCFYRKTAIHWCQSSWLDNYHERGRLYYFCRKHGLTKAYNLLGNLLKKLKQ